MLLMNERNQVASQVAGIDSVLAPLIPGFVFSAVGMLPLARLDRRGDVYREGWGCVRYTELHHQAIILSYVPPDRAVRRISRNPERLRVVARYVEGLAPVVRE